MTLPMLASDAVESKIRFPVIAQPKIDGVRAVHIAGGLTGRSLKQHANRHVTGEFSDDQYIGIDGEMIVGSVPTLADLCRLTTSALSTITGEPDVNWYVFDYITEDTKALKYKDRLIRLQEKVVRLHENGAGRVHLIQSYWVADMEELLALDSMWLDAGYEGTIIRDPEGLYKDGRSTVREGGLLRIKRFIEEEAEVLEILEGETNTNEAQQNELGLQFRSSHQANMVPNGMVGAIMCRSLKSGEIIKVGAGCMPHNERVHYFQNQSELIGKVIKYKHFPKGVKDKPRFPTFQSLRAESDM